MLLSRRSSAEVWHRSMEVTVPSRIDDDPMVPLFQGLGFSLGALV